MAPIIAALCMIFGFLLVIVFIAAMIFRMACRWCNIEQPGWMATIGIVLLSFLAWFIFEAVMISVLQEMYLANGYPPWEAHFVSFFLGYPCNMIVTTMLHILLMRVRLGKALEVWFIQQIILTSIFVVTIGLIAVAFLARNR